MGGILVGVGWILGSQATSMEILALTYGVIGGLGVGIVYNCPIGVVGRWFPERRGLAVGITVLGFGLSPLITAPIANSLIQSAGALDALWIMGLAFLVILVPLALPLAFPPAGWSPLGSAQGSSTSSDRWYNRNEMIHTRSF
ncbi:MAG TPA: MFS transporter [Methanomassiliicoccales archaeon]|nr:MFS transporter [Methanomassiliicoccales archaeon]